MAEDFQNEIYTKLLEKMGPQQSLILIDKLMIDVKNTRRGLQAAHAVKAVDLLKEPSHVLISLAGVVGAEELRKSAKKINEYKGLNGGFPSSTVKQTIQQLDEWLHFLKTDKTLREQVL
jgi:hypothetical protein